MTRRAWACAGATFALLLGVIGCTSVTDVVPRLLPIGVGLAVGVAILVDVRRTYRDASGVVPLQRSDVRRVRRR